ncbi:hypothetical protein COO60DRAFT_1706191, partial [Scenedesmus sp. NREL 46B-D3]
MFNTASKRQQQRQQQQQQQLEAPSVPAFSLAAALDPLAHLLLGLWALVQAWLRRWLVRAGLGLGLGLLALHLLLNKLGLPLANRQLLPGLLEEAQALSLREVRLAGVSRVWLPGLFGLGPLLTLQQLEVGPGPAEKSSAQVPEVHVRVLPAASLAQRQLQLQLAVVQPHVCVVQGSNYSWLGYPQDTSPVSSRDLLPGLTARSSSSRQRRQQQLLAAQEAAASGAAPAARGAGLPLTTALTQVAVMTRVRHPLQAAEAPAAVPAAAASAAGALPGLQQKLLLVLAAAQQDGGLHLHQYQQLAGALRGSSSSSGSSGRSTHPRQALTALLLSSGLKQLAVMVVNSTSSRNGVNHRRLLPAVAAITSSSPALAGSKHVRRTAAQVGSNGDDAAGSAPHSYGSGKSSTAAAGTSDELQEQDAAADEHSTAHSNGSASSGSGIVSEGGQPEQSSVGSSSDTSSSSGHSAEDSSEQAEAPGAARAPLRGPAGSAEPPQPQPPQRQANVLSAARSWLLERCQTLASAVLRVGMGAAGHVASSAAGAVRVHLSGLLPPPALHSVTISGGRLDYVVWGEPLERTVHNVAMRLSLGPGYSWLELLVHGDAAPRHPASTKVTLANPNARRHLRHVTPGAAGAARLRRFSCDVLPAAQPEPAVPRQGRPAAGAQLELGDALEGMAATPADDADTSVVFEAAAGSEQAAEAVADLERQQQQHSSSRGREGGAPAPALQLQGAHSRPGRHAGGGGSSSASNSSSSRPSGDGSGVAAAELHQPAAAAAGASAQQGAAAAAALPLETLHIPCGQQGIPSRVHFQLAEELHAWQQQQQQQQQGTCADVAQQTGMGHLTLRLRHTWNKAPTGRDNLLLSVQGAGLAAPLIERLLELPMDIHAGSLDGELHIAAYDDATWNFPAITGKLACRGAPPARTHTPGGRRAGLPAFLRAGGRAGGRAGRSAEGLRACGRLQRRVDLHFWDSPDDIQGASMDLLFERDRVYLHKATGSFGAIPLSVSGDLDLSPLVGQYRLQASVGPVEVNSLRATLGVRPIPFPVAGALRGVLHVTGPLEKPIFSGSASAVRPPPALLVGVEDTHALRALLSDPAAVAAYDRVPATAANGVFTLDTSTEMFVLHSGQAVPAGGGLLQAAGRMWVAAAAECDARAISMEAGGSGLNAGALAARYVSDPQQRAHGSASFTPAALSLASSGPGFQLRASAATSSPTAAQARTADTQAEATYFGTPRLEAFQLEGSLAGIDLLPLAAAAAPQPQAHNGSSSSMAAGMSSEAPPAFVDGSPVRLRVSGAVALSAVRESSPAARRQAGLTGDAGYLFTGPVVLDGLRLNQLSLCRHLAGDVNFTAPRLLLRGRGAGRAGEELAELDLALPLPAAPDVDSLQLHGMLRPRLYYPPGFAPAAKAAHAALPPAAHSSRAAVTGEQRSQAAAAQQQVAQGGSGAGSVQAGGDGGTGGWDEWAAQQHRRLPWTDDGAAAVSAAAAAEAQRASHVLLRRGDLHFSCTVNASGSGFAAALEHLPLDELELGSLRGLLVSAVLDVDLAAAAGRLAASLASPRFSGLAGTSASAQARWERDIVLLERAVLTQPNSRYELAAEYVLPPGVALPRSIAEAQAAASAAAAPEQRTTSSSSSGNHHHHNHHGAAGAGNQQQAAAGHQRHHHQQAEAAAAVSASDIEGGRWRLQLVVPHAAIEELLPAGQLLRRASRARFLAGLAGAAVSSAGGEFASQVRGPGAGARRRAGAALAARNARVHANARARAHAWAGVAALAEAAASAAAATAAASGQAAATITSGGSSGSVAPSLPGLQELRGSWSGRLTAVGGGPGPGPAPAHPRLEYDLRGAAWRAGHYTLDQLLLRGSADAGEGLALDEARLVVGQAQLTLRGTLLGRQQDASFELSDFPAVLLQPLFGALPALQHATPALDARTAAAGGRPPGGNPGSSGVGMFGAGSSSALSRLQSRLESSLSALGLRLPAGREEAVDPLAPFLGSPVSGLLHVRGSLGGSASAPTGVLHLALADGVLGSQRLAKAAASLALDAGQRLSLDVQLAPAGSAGHIKLAGSIDLAGEPSKQRQPAAASGGSGSKSKEGDVNSKGGRRAGRRAAEVKRGSSSRHPPPGPGVAARAAAAADGGMCLLTGLAPGITWGGGSAAVHLAASGPAAAPLLTGSASFSKGSLSSSLLRHPVTQLSGSCSLDGRRLAVAGLEARPATAARQRQRRQQPRGDQQDQQPGEGLAASLAGIELRLRNMYSGSLDASLQVAGSLAAPQLGGRVVFSR